MWIRERLLKLIVDGKLQRGEALASEGEMARQFDVSLGTMRKAIDGLVEQHVLVRRQGKRTFIAKRDSATAARLSFHMVAGDDGRELPNFAALLFLQSRSVTPHEAKRLDLKDDSEIIEMGRTRVFSDNGVMYERVFLPKKLFPNFKKQLGNLRPILLYEFYEQKFGVSVMDFEERIHAVKASKEVAAIIGCRVGAALLEIERISYNYDSAPIEMRVSLCETGTRHYLHARH
jgi:GntR family transcriptional regulator